ERRDELATLRADEAGKPVKSARLELDRTIIVFQIAEEEAKLNFGVDAKRDQQACNNPPDLGAAAITTITMGAESYRFGKVLEWDAAKGKVVDSGEAYAKQWETISQQRGAPRHIIGWNPENKDPQFSRQKPDDYQKLEGPWINGKDPAA
ncbi:MAG: hypothetical protein WD176_01030, partial [Pirellulales bacterium]